jgi:hypothetical protein
MRRGVGPKARSFHPVILSASAALAALESKDPVGDGDSTDVKNSSTTVLGSLVLLPKKSSIVVKHEAVQGVLRLRSPVGSLRSG